MSYTTEDWRNAITNLIKKTSKREISWDSSELFQADAWTEVDRSFECIIESKTYVVSSTRKRHYTDEDVYYWIGGGDFSIFKTDGYDPVLLASAPEDLHVIGTLFVAAEKNFAFTSNALGDLL